MNRRYAHDAGPSWRKWGDPLIQRPPRVVRNVLFVLLCIDLGALAGLLVSR